jgi:hypothetical protein
MSITNMERKSEQSLSKYNEHVSHNMSITNMERKSEQSLSKYNEHVSHNMSITTYMIAHVNNMEKVSNQLKI